MPRRCRRGAGVLGRGCIVSDRFYIPTQGSALATFRAIRRWAEKVAASQGKTLDPEWYKDGPEDRPALYKARTQESEGEEQ